MPRTRVYETICGQLSPTNLGYSQPKHPFAGNFA